MRAKILSFLYRIVRRIVLVGVTFWQKKQHKVTHIEPAITFGDKSLLALNRLAGPLLFKFKTPGNLSTKLHHLTFPSPVIVSSFKDDIGIIQVWLEMGAGGATLKTIMKEARFGNEQPRIQEVCIDGENTIINAMGLPGKGVFHFSKRIAQAKFNPDTPIGISIGGASVQEYQDVFSYLNEHLDLLQKHPCYWEVNISCPNTHEGQDLSKDIHLLKKLLIFMRENCDHVIGVKLSPDQSNEQLKQYAQMISEFSHMYINVGNTQYRSCLSLNLSPSQLSIGGGGLSGHPLYPRTKEMVQLLAPFKVPLVATGGIATPEQVQELLNAGATLVGIATALVQDPYCLVKINQALSIQQMS